MLFSRCSTHPMLSGRRYYFYSCLSFRSCLDALSDRIASYRITRRGSSGKRSADGDLQEKRRRGQENRRDRKEYTLSQRNNIKGALSSHRSLAPELPTIDVIDCRQNSETVRLQPHPNADDTSIQGPTQSCSWKSIQLQHFITIANNALATSYVDPPMKHPSMQQLETYCT